MRILAPYLPEASRIESDEPCFTIVRVSPKNWQVVDASDGFLICSCTSKFLAGYVLEAMEAHWQLNQ